MNLNLNIGRKVLLLLFVTTLFTAVGTASLTALDVPPLEGRVNDLAGILSSSAESEIEAYLKALEENSGAQIAVLTIPSLEGESLEEYSIRVVDKWALGDAERDDGALLLISMEERKIRIETGYGLEGSLTDMKSGFIIREILQPRFRAGDFDTGVYEAVRAMGGVVSGNADISPGMIEAAAEKRESSGGGVSLNFLVFFLILFFGAFGRRRRGFGSALLLGALLGSSSRRGGYSSRGGFSGGGFSGGGFSGGGGGFGGGGASGGW